LDKNKDIFGNAIKAFYEENDRTDIVVHSPDFEDDIIPVEYLFRNFLQMPEIEQKALSLCQGKILDVGCGAGSHSLYLQQEKNLQVKAIDTSEGAIEIARKRGIENATCEDFFKLKDETFDTILMLMNGIGIVGELKNLNHFFKNSKSLLNEGGKIIIDSSDLIYLFEGEIEENEVYYGELQFNISYKKQKADQFNWLYIDPNLLKKYAKANNFDCEILQEGENHEYLACLSII